MTAARPGERLLLGWWRGHHRSGRSRRRRWLVGSSEGTAIPRRGIQRRPGVERQDEIREPAGRGFWTLRKLLEEGRIDLARDYMLWDELTATRWTVDSQGPVALEPKDGLRTGSAARRTGRMPRPWCSGSPTGVVMSSDQPFVTWGGLA